MYMMDYYSDLKKNEILAFVAKWMQLENIMLSEIGQTENTKGQMFSLICGS